MIQVLQRAVLVLIVVNAWFLFGIVVSDYLFGNLFGLLTTSIYTQAWAILLLVALSFSSALKASQLKIIQWYSTTGLGIYIAEKCYRNICSYRALVVRALRALYINLYLLADVIFCVGAPLLIISASAGWWLLEDVSYVAMLGYCCMISLIVFTGLYSNLVRLLSLGYFFGYWLLSDSMLLYPFAAPALVQKHIATMLSGSVSDWLPVIGLVLIVYLLARRGRAKIIERSDWQSSKSLLRELFKLFPKRLNRQLFGNYLSLFCLLMAAPLVMLMLNSIIGYLNPHVLFAGFAIWMLDRLWQTDVVHEPSLSTDCRYFVNLIWKH
jgi:hypothetical protein